MRTMRAALFALLSTLVLVAAGCGSEDVGVGGTTAADKLKPGALVYWQTQSDPDSDQWQQVEELLRRFPDGDEWIAELRKSFENDTKVTWEEVKAGLGDQFALAVYATSLTDVKVVGLLNPDDPDKTLALVDKLNAETESPDDRAVARKVDGWVAISDKETSIDAALKAEGGQALSDADAFKDAMAELPDDALSRAYFDAARAMDAFAAADPETTKALQMFGLDRLDFAGAWAKARDDGAEVGGAVSGEGANKLLGTGEPYTSKLLDHVPADAFAFYSFQGGGVTEQLRALRDNSLYAMAVQEFERELGVSLDKIVALFDGEVVFYAAPGAPVPQLTLLLESTDPAAGREDASNLLRAIARRAGGEFTESDGVATATIEGFMVHVGLVEGAVVLSTSKQAFEDVGEKLEDSDQFKQALDAADTPDEYTGLLWTDLGEAIEIVLGYAGMSGEEIPSEVSRNLEPLRSLVAYGTHDGNLATSLLFLEIGE